MVSAHLHVLAYFSGWVVSIKKRETRSTISIHNTPTLKTGVLKKSRRIHIFRLKKLNRREKKYRGVVLQNTSYGLCLWLSRSILYLAGSGCFAITLGVLRLVKNGAKLNKGTCFTKKTRKHYGKIVQFWWVQVFFCVFLLSSDFFLVRSFWVHDFFATDCIK